jgi:hypothetical protein
MVLGAGACLARRQAGSYPGMRNPTVRLYANALAISGVFVTFFELTDRHHESNKLSTQVAAGVLIWISLATAGVLTALWARGCRPTGWSRTALSLLVSLELMVPVVTHPRHPSTKPVGGRVVAALIIVLLIAALIWSILWAAARIIRRTRPRGISRGESLCSWSASLVVAGAVSATLALNNNGFDSHHVVLLVGIAVFVWLALALALRVLVALAISVRERGRPAQLSA